MENGRQIVSLSLPKKSLLLLNKICRQEEKTRSEIMRELINRYLAKKEWEQIFVWGEETAKKFKIESEADILKLVND